MLVVLANYPELLRVDAEATRAGDLLVHPLARQLHRAAAEQAADTGKLDVPAWLDKAGVADRATIATALEDERFAELADPRGIPAEIGDPARDSACERRNSDEHAFAEGSTSAGG